MRPIGYYVHHSGRGHFDRACLIASRLQRPCTLIGTLPDQDIDSLSALRLPNDIPSDGMVVADDNNLPHALHFAPVGFPPLRERMASIAAWVEAHRPAVAVIDVSVEVTLFFRLLSVATIVFRLAGDRSDAAHLEAFRAAERIIAPFPAPFEHAATPAWVRDKTIYAGFIHAQVRNEAPRVSPNTVAVVMGFGGSRMAIADVILAARATPDHRWHVYGIAFDGDGELPSNLTMHAFVADIDDRVARAHILIGAAGDGLVSLAVRHRKRFICIPEERPYGEQTTKANVLAALGVAIVRQSWPHSSDWPALLAAAAQIDLSGVDALHSHASLANVCKAIDEIANKFDR